MDNAETTRQWWYYVAFGLIAGAGVTGYLLLSPEAWSILVLALSVVLITILDRATRPPKPQGFTRPQPAYALIIIVGIIAAVALLFIARALVIDQGQIWFAWLTGFVFFACAAGSRFLPANLR